VAHLLAAAFGNAIDFEFEAWKLAIDRA